MAITPPKNPSKWDIIPIHSSDRAAFKFCRRQWSWGSPARMNLIPRADVHGVDKNLWFGTGIHSALEAFYNPVLKRDPVEAWLTWFELQWRGGIVTQDEVKGFADRNPQPHGVQVKVGDSIPETIMSQRQTYRVDGLCDILPDFADNDELFMGMKDMGVGMMRFYKDYSEANDNFRVISLEHDFSVPVMNEKGEVLYAIDNRKMPDGWEPDFELGNEFGPLIKEYTQPITGYPPFQRIEKQVHVRGRMDMILQEQEYGRYGIMDHKTASAVKEDYFRHLELDEQCTCVPLNTQALTPDGWKVKNELCVGDTILAYDYLNEEMKWTPILAINEGFSQVVNFRNEQGTFNTIVTPNHRWVGRRRVGAGRSDEHWNLWEVETYKFPISHGKLILSAVEPDGGEYTITPDEAALIGWILGDGHFNFNNNTLTVSIAQAVHKYANEIADLMERMQLAHSARMDTSKLSGRPYVSWRIKVKQITEIFERAGIDYTKKKNEQDYTNFILGLTLEAREAFCEAGLKAEGAANKGFSKSIRLNWFCQNPGSVKDAFRLAFFLNGQYTTPGTDKGFGIKVDSEIDSRTVYSIPLNEVPVWCPTTQYGTWIMKQDEQICITGNSYLAFGELEARINKLEYGSLEFITYQALLKGYPKPPTITTRGMPSLNRNDETTTAELFEKCIKDMGLEPVFRVDTKMQSYYTWLLEQGDKRYIQRTDTWRNQMQRKNAMTRLYYEAQDMLNNPVPYPNPSRNYSCINCKFRTPCIQAESGDDFLQTLHDGYIPNWDR